MMVWQVRSLSVIDGNIMDVNLFDNEKAIVASIAITYNNKKEDMPYIPTYFPLSKRTKIKDKEGVILFEIIPTQIYSIGEHL